LIAEDRSLPPAGNDSPLLVSQTGSWAAPNRTQIRTDSRGGWNARAALGRALKIRSDEALAQLWEAVRTAACDRQGKTLMLPGVNGELGTMITVRPAREQGFAVVTLDTFGTPPPALQVQLVGDLLGLTRSESEVALQLFEGMSIAGIAAARGTSVDAVRGHVKSALRKAGLPSQKHLMALLARVATMAAHGAQRRQT
jgi:DNA-binding CsgD family transcriptional regulator